MNVGSDACAGCGSKTVIRYANGHRDAQHPPWCRFHPANRRRRLPGARPLGGGP